MITNHVVAVNARDNADPYNVRGSDTVVKFGGWDKDMIDGDLLILETVADDDGNT